MLRRVGSLSAETWHYTATVHHWQETGLKLTKTTYDRTQQQQEIKLSTSLLTMSSFSSTTQNKISNSEPGPCWPPRELSTTALTATFLTLAIGEGPHCQAYTPLFSSRNLVVFSLKWSFTKWSKCSTGLQAYLNLHFLQKLLITKP